MRRLHRQDRSSPWLNHISLVKKIRHGFSAKSSWKCLLMSWSQGCNIWIVFAALITTSIEYVEQNFTQPGCLRDEWPSKNSRKDAFAAICFTAVFWRCYKNDSNTGLSMEPFSIITIPPSLGNQLGFVNLSMMPCGMYEKLRVTGTCHSEFNRFPATMKNGGVSTWRTQQRPQ